jgi:hypothetical protein
VPIGCFASFFAIKPAMMRSVLSALYSKSAGERNIPRDAYAYSNAKIDHFQY